MAGANVPEFGRWDNEANIPYTMYFDNARKNRGGKIMNPNDPQENPDLLPNASPKPRFRQEQLAPQGASKPVSEQRGQGDFRQSPARYEAPVQRAGNGQRPGGRPQSFEKSPVHPQQARSPRPSAGSESPLNPRYAKQNVGSEHNFERSPVHPLQQAKPPARGSGSTNSKDGSSGRPRQNQSKGDQGATVPRFGQWNEKDPQSAENFTDIFEKVREERNNPAGATPKHPSSSTHNQASYGDNQAKKSCCFPWL